MWAFKWNYYLHVDGFFSNSIRDIHGWKKSYLPVQLLISTWYWLTLFFYFAFAINSTVFRILTSCGTRLKCTVGRHAKRTTIWNHYQPIFQKPEETQGLYRLHNNGPHSQSTLSLSLFLEFQPFFLRVLLI